jgi:hypothetical protein
MITINIDETNVLSMPEKTGLPFLVICAVFLVLLIPHAGADPLTDQNSSLELKYDSDSAAHSLYSLGSGGHAVYFDNPGTITITGMKIFGRMYGTSPENPVHVRILDTGFNTIYSYDTTYGEFPQDNASWVTVPFPPFSRTGDFYACVFTQSGAKDSAGGGVFVGYDTTTKSGHSHIVSVNAKKITDANIGSNKDIPMSNVNWKIRVLYSGQPPSALAAVPQGSPQPAAQQTGIPSSLVPVLAVIVLAIAGIGAFGWYKYRQKPGVPGPRPAVLSPQILSADGHHDVFISYAHGDKPIADAVCAKLEARHIRCWMAPRDVPPGMDFPAAIIRGIEESRVMVLVFSSQSNVSPHVLREITSAVNKGIIVVPFRIEDVIPSKSMEYLISVPHWLDAITPPLEQHLETLVLTVEKILSGNPPRTG